MFIDAILGFFGLGKKADKFIGSIDRAIDTLASQSDAWRETLEKLSGDLDQQLTKLGRESAAWRKEADSIVKKDIPNILNETSNAIGQEFRCDIDFIIRRTRSQLIDLRNLVAQQVKLPLRENPYNSPFVCATNPKTVDLTQIGTVTEDLQVAGYNFFDGDLSVKVLNLDGSSVNETDSLTISNSYFMTIRIAKTSDGSSTSITPKTLILTNITDKITIEDKNSNLIGQVAVVGQDLIGVIPNIAGSYKSKEKLTYIIKQTGSDISMEEVDLSDKFISSSQGSFDGKVLSLKYKSIGGETGTAALNLLSNGDLEGEYIRNDGARFYMKLFKEP
ncbi:MAG: hypothetical protein HC852_00505 [Acaryochloridaceae cyanobacterium RU_4_10]|nr:hypothetical protein [Acaryochloridaceae cyanobacterium RU_4_10]